MRLGDFILRDMEAILARWEAFAATRLPAADHMASLELRNHAQQILEAIVLDLATAQNAVQQSAKSMGLAPIVTDAPETAAQTHAVLRAKSGFNIEQLASEYRALRSSVLTRWMEACLPEAPLLDDVIRFNEAIDQALAESITFFSAHVTKSRNLLLGMLSHDLRSPLQTIQMTAQYLRELQSSDDVGHAAVRLINSGARMQELLDDLIDYNRTELGLGIRVSPKADVDLGAVCAEELDLIRAAYPERTVELHVAGVCRGAWDGGRIQQLVNNLVVNAIHYGDDEQTTVVAVRGEEAEVHISVANAGRTIDRDTLAHLFEPLRRGTAGSRTNDAGLGLGLYISNEIAKAHGGGITVTSEDERTVFAVRLPRHRQDPAGRPSPGQ
jgi:signal transduction histidine kinase